MVKSNVAMIDLGSSVGILYCINKEDLPRQQIPLLNYDPASKQFSKPRSQFGSAAGRIWSSFSDRASELTGVAATAGTAYLIFSNLRFPVHNLNEALIAGAITVLIPLIAGTVTYNSTQSAMEYCGEVAGRTYQAIAGIFDVDNYL